MRAFPTAIPGTAIVCLIAAGAWHARQFDSPPGTAVGSAARNENAPPSDITASRVEWSADGLRLLSLSRGERGAEGFVALHDVALSWQVPDPTIVDVEARDREGGARGDNKRANGHA